MKWFPLLILLAIYIGGCNHPPGPLQPPDQRREADDALQQCIAAKGRPVLSHVVYWGVRLGGHGWLPTPWRLGFGRRWPDGYYSKP